MADEKKLKRGLKDISPLFFSSAASRSRTIPVFGEPVVKPIEQSNLTSERGEIPFRSGQTERVPKIYCATIFPSHPAVPLLDHPHFLNVMRAVYPEVCLVSHSDHRVFPSAEPAPVQQVLLMPYQIQDILHPEPKTAEENNESDLQEDICFLMDSGLIFHHYPRLFELLDYGILYVSSDSSDTLLSAYQNMVRAAAWNPALRFYLLVGGLLAEGMSETIYERFATIASRYLAKDIGFLGWLQDHEIRLNPDLLLDLDGEGLVGRVMKQQLARVARGELMSAA